MTLDAPIASSRPLLLPQNRRLRHLRGIYLRNLNFSSAPSSSSTPAQPLNHPYPTSEPLSPDQFHAVDDNSLFLSSASRPAAAATPATTISQTLSSLDEASASSFSASTTSPPAANPPQLHHAHSTDGILQLGAEAAAAATASAATATARVQRPGAGRMRRRSTNWAGASPDVRQRRLEDVLNGGVADVFFSLHCDEAGPEGVMIKKTGGGEARALNGHAHEGGHRGEGTKDLEGRRARANIHEEKGEAKQGETEERAVTNGIKHEESDEDRDSAVESEDELVYISEVAEQAMNPSFRLFDMAAYGPAITRRSTLTIKVWAKQNDYRLLFEEEINFRQLRHVGKLENHPFPRNCILIHLTDGIYTPSFLPIPRRHAPPGVSSSSGPNGTLSPPPPQPQPQPSSSYSALMRLASLDDSIQDALSTRARLASQINAVLLSRRRDGDGAGAGVGSDGGSGDGDEQSAVAPAPPAALSARYLDAQRRQLRQAQRRRAELQASLAARRAAMRDGLAAQRRAQAEIEGGGGGGGSRGTAAQELAGRRARLEATAEAMRGQRRRVCEELLAVFPIEATARPLLFTICGLPLPNSMSASSSSSSSSAAPSLSSTSSSSLSLLSYASNQQQQQSPATTTTTTTTTTTAAAVEAAPSEDVLAAALGHCAHLVHLLQCYLAVPLPYPVAARGSRSLVHDHTSLLAGGAGPGSGFGSGSGSGNGNGSGNGSGSGGGGGGGGGGVGAQQRAFPLYPRGAVRYRFDYAVFLLNKDVERLAESQGLRVADIRHTLPNLKYVLYVCAAGGGGGGGGGREELPARKAGGVRGLLAASGRRAPAGGGPPLRAPEREPVSEEALPRRGSGEEAEGGEETRRRGAEAMSLRTSGLRESLHG